MDCILQPGEDGKGGLFLGSFGAANNTAWHKTHGIKGILSVVKLHNYLQFKFDMKDGQIEHHKHIELEDDEDQFIKKHFEESIQFIDQVRNIGNVLVHCQAGVSRSSTIVIAYMMQRRQWSYDEAFGFVKSCRKIICPNEGFIEQLKSWEDELSIKKSKGML